MDQEEERVLYLARAGNEKIFKYGTYNVVQNRAITQDHPFYVKREDGLEKISYVPPGQPIGAPGTPGAGAAPGVPGTGAAGADAGSPASFGAYGADAATFDTGEAAPPPPPPEAVPDDPEALAAQVLSSNFKVGLSQEEVDALLNGM